MKSLSYYFPTPTLRTLILILFTIILYVNFGKEYDIIAGNISIILVSLIAITFTFAIINILINRKKEIEIQISPLNLIGQITLKLNFAKFYILPFIKINIRINFKSKHVLDWEHSITKFGITNLEIIKKQIDLPAVYQTNSIIITYNDIFGFFQYIRNKPLNSIFKVYPDELNFTEEIRSSFIQDGESDYHNKSPNGDYYEIKPYHPTDGTKLIIWKSYAKNRTLIARAPDLASEPTGCVACYFACGKNQKLYQKAVGLFKKIKDLEMDAIYKFEGNNQVYTSIDNFKDNLIENTWNSLDNMTTNNQNLSNLMIETQDLQALIIFCDKNLIDYTNSLNKIIQELKFKNILITVIYE